MPKGWNCHRMGFVKSLCLALKPLAVESQYLMIADPWHMILSFVTINMIATNKSRCLTRALWRHPAGIIKQKAKLLAFNNPTCCSAASDASAACLGHQSLFVSCTADDCPCSLIVCHKLAWVFIICYDAKRPLALTRSSLDVVLVQWCALTSWSVEYKVIGAQSSIW